MEKHMVIDDRAGRVKEMKIRKLIKDTVDKGLSVNKNIIDKCVNGNNIMMLGDVSLIKRIASLYSLSTKLLDESYLPAEGDEGEYFVKRDARLKRFIENMILDDKSECSFDEVIYYRFKRDKIRDGYVFEEYAVEGARTKENIEKALYKYLLLSKKEIEISAYRMILKWREEARVEDMRAMIFEQMVNVKKAKK